ncbi:hypothetical protein LCGC14_2373230, partial [marine sediment metagenome]
MSEERKVLHVPKMGGTQTIGVTKAREIASNIDDLTDAELEARLSRVLERGIIVDRTTVDLPEGVHGEWVCDDDSEIVRMQLMGFELDDKYAVTRSSHADGSGGTAKIGDIVGIGTSTPGKPLHVLNATADIVATFESLDAKGGIKVKDDAGESDIYARGNDLYFDAGGTAIDQWILKNDGNIEFNVANKGFVSNGARIDTVVDATTNAYRIQDNSGGDIWFHIDTKDNRTLFPTGNVGIGTSSPDSVFHIKANIAGNVGSHSAGQIIIQNPADDVTSNVVITGYESDGSGNPDQQLWYLGSSSSS